MKIGVFGGTFDPIHLGHLAIADEAMKLLGLNKVIFMPAGQPYFKDKRTISPAEDRVKMIKLAITDRPAYSISRLEIERPGPSYAVESVAKIKKELNPTDEVFFIMGWDSVMSLHLWHEAEMLIHLCRIVAAPRPRYPKPDLKSLERGLPGIAGRVVLMERPLIDISATQIRERVRKHLSINGLVPSAIEGYIRENGLYR